MAVAQSINAGGLLFAVGAVKGNVGHLDAVMELHAIAFQVLDHGQDHGFILVVAGKAQGGEIRQAADVVDVALKVALHLQGAVPVLKGEHGAPVQPEVGVQDFVIKEVGDLFLSYNCSSGVMNSFKISMAPLSDRPNLPSVWASSPQLTVARHRL